MKKCTICGERKSMDLFYRSVKHSDGYQNRCSECQNRRRHGNNFRGGHADLPESEIVIRHIIQDGKCASCDVEISIEESHIDHDHSCCGKSRSCVKCRRALLCRACNVSLGILHEDYEKIMKLALYAQTHGRGK